ncbi:hypothetical protein BIY24_04585 [Halobacteriovorax marinus]|nr:hypothetical protein [Halobacteriovorax marinus]ATH07236.1 hypothetical protein BIY24_04585 [Halobacteriovorax marinus]
MKKILLYFKLQLRLFLILICTTSIPLLLVYLYSPYEWDKLYWLFITFIFALKVVFYKDAPYKKKITPLVREMLTKEYKRVPSKMEVVARIEDMINARDVMLLSSALLIVVITILFSKL